MKAVEHLEFSIDQISGSMCDTSHEDALEVLDLVVEALRELHGETNDPMRYEDGTPVAQRVRVAEGVSGTYYHRHDGDFDEWLAKFRPNLQAVK
jgi:hypothetical protein